MKTKIRDIDGHATLYRDDATGIAWIEDGHTGLGFSVHANIDRTGSVEGMKRLGYWGRDDRTVRSHGWIYNIDSFVCTSEYDRIVADECRCQGCIERRERQDRAAAV